MKNNKKLSDAIGQIDQKYIDEYVNARKVRRPMVWRAVIAATLAVALLAGGALALPAMLNNATEQSENLPVHPAPGPDYIQIPDSASGVEYITDDAGNRVLHVMDTLEIPKDIAASLGLYNNQIEETAEMMLINWSNIIDNAKQSTSPDELIFIGTPVSKDVYVWDKEVTINGEGWVVEYDASSGTTALKEMYECEPYQAIRRTTVQLSGIRIDEILKQNNTTGYEVGDIIYFYSERSSTIDDLAKTPVNDMSIYWELPEDLAWETTEIGITPGIPDNDMSIHHGDSEIAIETGLADIPTNDMSIHGEETAVEETAVLPSTPKPAVESGAYIPAITTPAMPFIPSNTEIAPETAAPAIDYNGDGKVDEMDKAVENTTLPSSGQRMYVARVNTREVSDIVRNSGIVPEQLWNSTHSCTAEEYRSGKFHNDMSNMP